MSRIPLSGLMRQFKNWLIEPPKPIFQPYNTSSYHPSMANVEHYDHLPAGDYYIGDLCYVVENWQEYHKLFFPVEGGDQHVGVFTNSAGVKFANYGTAFGDGIYRDEEGNEYAVDSGSIGCIPIEAIQEPHALGNIVNFPVDSDCEYIEATGTIRIGDVFIDTDLGYMGEQVTLTDDIVIEDDFLIN